MSLNVNTVILAGHLTRDPELRPLAGDKVVVQFSLAINRRYKGADGEVKEDSTFVDCEAWGRTAELIGQYLAKGSAAYVEGRLKLDSWQDKEGKNRQRLKVVVDNVQFVGPPKAKSGAPAEQGEPVAAGTPTRIPGRPAIGHDEPPF
jgi:single-strand DNA-binding protein